MYFVHILSLVIDNSPSRVSGREENGCRNYFMVNFHERMGLAGIELADPGSAVRHITTVRHIIDCATLLKSGPMK